jgi:hypothetical protein
MEGSNAESPAFQMGKRLNIECKCKSKRLPEATMSVRFLEVSPANCTLLHLPSIRGVRAEILTSPVLNVPPSEHIPVSPLPRSRRVGRH